MTITIDNEDGLGARDYTAAVTAEGPISIDRKLNAPSRCVVEISLGLGGLPAPARRGRVVVTHQGTTLFTGYLAVEPVAVYVGETTTGPVYRAKLTALSDEWLLDKQGSGSGSATDGLTLSVSGAGLVTQLTQVAQTAGGSVTAGLSVAAGGTARALGAFAVQPAANWSTNAAAAANASYATYRVVNGAVSVSSAGAVTHVLNDADGSLNLSALSTANARELANDVTLTGEEEAAAFVQEIFQGDGSTTTFELSEAAFRGSHRTLLQDSFTGAVFDSSQWTVRDGGNHLQITAAGLTMNGGNGYDGQTTLSAVNAIEMSGFVVAELGGVLFGAGSAGVLAGFYSGVQILPNCFAGFRVRQSASTTGGVTVVVPVLNGVETGAVFTPIAGHRYTLRLRLFCVEMQRVPQRYYCLADQGVAEFGAISGIDAPMQAVFEVLDEGVGSNTPASVLYDTAAAGAPLTGTPATCTFAAASSLNLIGSVSSIAVTRPGSMWVLSTLPNGAGQTRLIGTAGEGVDCKASYGSSAGSTAKVTFFAGRVPAAGERVTVTYRTQRRAVARLADTDSITSEAAAAPGITVPGVSRWLGKVVAPAARSSVDCEAAAQAVLAMATSRSASLHGQYRMTNPVQDVWPGDILQITSGGATHSLLVRDVAVTDRHAVPEIAEYHIRFANDWATEWADGLGLHLSEAIAADAALPALAAGAPAEVAANMQQAAVMSLSGTSMQVDAGLMPPSGGGFEVRRKDWSFGVAVDTPDLVLRSPVRSFSLPRSAQSEQFYVRMYDGSTPPLYSRFSAAFFVNWPVGD